MCNFRKYPYLPHGRDFFLRPSHPSRNSNYTSYISLIFLALQNTPIPNSLGNSNPFCGASVNIFWWCTMHDMTRLYFFIRFFCYDLILEQLYWMLGCLIPSRGLWMAWGVPTVEAHLFLVAKSLQPAFVLLWHTSRQTLKTRMSRVFSGKQNTLVTKVAVTGWFHQRY